MPKLSRPATASSWYGTLGRGQPRVGPVGFGRPGRRRDGTPYANPAPNTVISAGGYTIILNEQSTGVMCTNGPQASTRTIHVLGPPGELELALDFVVGEATDAVGL